MSIIRVTRLESYADRLRTYKIVVDEAVVGNVKAGESADHRWLKGRFVVMKRLVIAVLSLAVFLMPLNAYGSTFVLFPFNPDLSNFIQTYHMHMKPQQALDVFFEIDLKKFEEEARKTDHPHAIAILLAFYIHIIHDHPERVLSFAKRIAANSSSKHATLGVEIVARGATKDRSEAIAVISKAFQASSEHIASYERLKFSPYAAGLRAENWQALDVLWACFFATDDDAYIQEIAGSLVYYQIRDEHFNERLRYLSGTRLEPGSEEYQEYVTMLTAQAAMAGLTDNAQQYPAVLSALQKIAENESGKVAEGIEMIIEETSRAK